MIITYSVFAIDIFFYTMADDKYYLYAIVAMYNLYQSPIRKAIQYDIYAKPSYTIRLFGVDYVGVIKRKTIGPFSIQWIQIMGVQFPDNDELVKKELARVSQELRKQYGTVFVQFGIINEIIRFDNITHKSPEFDNDMRQARQDVQRKVADTFGLQVAFRENMPQSNIIYDVHKTDEELIAEMNS